MKTTIKDIAKDTGLSTATISKYLNEKPINPDTQKRIEKSIKKLNYIPNKTAQILRTQKSKIIYLLLSDLDNYFWGNIISTITHYFEKYNFTVVTTSFHHNQLEEEKLIQNIIFQKASGVILLPCTNCDHTYTALQKAEIPVVVIDNFPIEFEKYPVDYVTSDNYNGGRELALYAIKNGHKHISIIDKFDNSSPILERVQGIKDVYKEHNLPIPQIHSIDFLPTYENIMSKQKGTFKPLEFYENKISLIIFTNYVSAVEGLLELQSSQHNFFNNLSILVFDDEPLFLSVSHPITAIKQNLHQIGTTAAELLLKRINQDYSEFPEKKLVKTEFIERKSVINIPQ